MVKQNLISLHANRAMNPKPNETASNPSAVTQKYVIPDLKGKKPNNINDSFSCSNIKPTNSDTCRVVPSADSEKKRKLQLHFRFCLPLLPLVYAGETFVHKLQHFTQLFTRYALGRARQFFGRIPLLHPSFSIV